MKKSDEPRLTLGCEFECVLAYRKPKDELNLSFEQRLHVQEKQGMRAAKIVKAVLSKKFTSKCANSKCRAKFDWKPKLTNSNCAGETDLWRVDFDRGTHPTDGENDALSGAQLTDYTLIGIEIRTPKLEYRPSNDSKQQTRCDQGQHKIAYHQEISAVIERLNASLCKLGADGLHSLFEETKEPLAYEAGQSKTYDQQLQELKDNGKQRGYLYVNKVSSFHVHIGYPDGPSEQFSLPHIKHILYAMLSWERQIDALHAVNRISGSTLPTADYEPRTNNLRPYYDRYVYNQPMSVGFIHKAHVRRLEKNFPRETYAEENWLAYNLDNWMELLSGTTSIGQQLPLIAMGAKSCVINLDNLYTYGGLPKDMRTIEFRQSIWTLDSEATLSFVDFIAKLVQFCAVTTEDEAKKNFDQESKNRNVLLDTFDILDKFECKKDTKNHYKACKAGTSTSIKRLIELKQQATRLKDNGAKDQPLLRMVLQNVEDQLSNFSSLNIQAKIHQKLLTGGYG